MKQKQVNQEIQRITKQIINKYKPEKIILFGSAIWGKFGEDSDLDFLIIKEDVPYYGIERMRKVQSFIDYSLPCDFLVAKPSEIAKRLSMGDPFVKEIINKGKILYG